MASATAAGIAKIKEQGGYVAIRLEIGERLYKIRMEVANAASNEYCNFYAALISIERQVRDMRKLFTELPESNKQKE